MRRARRWLGWICGAALACAAPAQHPPPDAAALRARHEQYGRMVAESLLRCLGAPDETLPTLSPALGKLCTCFLGYRPAEPELHVIELSVAADGTVRRVSEAASGTLETFGTCRPDDVQGLALPPPPGATRLRFRLTDVYVEGD